MNRNCRHCKKPNWDLARLQIPRAATLFKYSPDDLFCQSCRYNLMKIYNEEKKKYLSNKDKKVINTSTMLSSSLIRSESIDQNLPPPKRVRLAEVLEGMLHNNERSSSSSELSISQTMRNISSSASVNNIPPVIENNSRTTIPQTTSIAEDTEATDPIGEQNEEVASVSNPIGEQNEEVASVSNPIGEQNEDDIIYISTSIESNPIIYGNIAPHRFIIKDGEANNLPLSRRFSGG